MCKNTCVHSTGGTQKENDSGGIEASLTEVVAFALYPTGEQIMPERWERIEGVGPSFVACMCIQRLDRNTCGLI